MKSAKFSVTIWIWEFSELFSLIFNSIICQPSDVKIERKLNGLKAENVFFILVIKLASKNINISRYGKFEITSSFRRLYKISRFHFFIRQFDLYLIIDLIFCNKFQIKSNQINDLWKFIQIKSNQIMIWFDNQIKSKCIETFQHFQRWIEKSETLNWQIYKLLIRNEWF